MALKWPIILICTLFQIMTIVCKCYYNLSNYSLDCSKVLSVTKSYIDQQKNLQNIEIRSLDLSYNNLNSIEIEINATNLLHLNISYNLISAIAVNDFENLTNLEILDLRYNSIKEISDECFKNIRKLNQLILSHNFIQKFNADSLLQSLKVLFLDFNQLESISEQSNSIEILNLAENQFKRDLNLNYPNLDSVIFDNNFGLRTINFTNSTKIRSISINGLGVLENFNFLAGHSFLRNLSMRNCNLSYVHDILIEISRQLLVFDLRDNAFLCNNRKTIGKIQDLIKKYPINYDLKCSGPKSLKGKNIIKLYILTHSEKKRVHLAIAVPILVAFMAFVIMATIFVTFDIKIPFCRRKPRYQLLDNYVPDNLNMGSVYGRCNNLVDVYI